ncbi:MAG: hypothetical protein AB1921_18840 [Thermodesulfobacteriota bacterium]
MGNNGAIKEIGNQTFILISGHLYGVSLPQTTEKPEAQVAEAETDRDLCPHCRTGILRRIRRSRIMRLLPESRHYACPFCHSTFLFFLGSRKIRLSRDQQERHTRMSFFGSRALPVHWTPAVPEQ